MGEKKSRIQALKELLHLIEISLDPDLMVMCDEIKREEEGAYYNEEHEITMQEYAEIICGEAKKRGIACAKCEISGNCKEG